MEFTPTHPSPNFTYRTIRWFGRNAIQAYRKVISWLDEFKPFIRTLPYQGFTVYYSKGTSLVELHGVPPVRFGGTYERYETATIVQALAQVEAPILIDVGANIGLLSLNVLAAVPPTRIFAFEPSPHPRRLLEQTIATNQLQERLTVYDCALGQQVGTATFTAHSTEHASGDGFRDTGRAGQAEIITVAVQTLDSWWQAQGCPAITAIKLDTEGSEFWILQGAVQLLAQCQPLIVLEINQTNLQPYPHNSRDLFDWLTHQGYSLSSLDGEPVSANNLEEMTRSHETFMAQSNP